MLLLFLFVLTVTTIHAQINIHGKVFGGACQADVGGSTFVDIGADNFDVIINAVYGGNDVSGSIGTDETAKVLPFTPEVNTDSKTYIDNTFDTFIRANLSSKKIFIGKLFGGGDGSYDYTSAKLSDGKTDNPYYGMSSPVIGKTYLQINGGTFGQLFGGGNNATVTKNTTICIDNTSVVVNSIKKGDQELLNTDRIHEMNLNTTQTSIEGAFQFGRVFGGNNFADMAIRPRWFLKKGKIRDLYSGGNEGRMTSPEGLLLEINADVENAVTTDAEVLWINNVYGGCRKANVQPLYADGTPVPTSSIQLPESENQGKVPAGFSARVRVLKGYVNNVYGGNDISGTVYGGNTVGIFTTIHGNVYGGGNGSYAYTDNPDLASDAIWGDYYYAKGDNSVEALNAHRPQAERVSIRVSGTETKRTIVEGALYVGGNSATLEKKSGDIRKATAELKIGSYVTIDKVFLGNNGEDMVDASANGTLAKYAGNVTNDAGQSKDFSSLELTAEATFAKYMEGCALKIDPDVVFDDLSNSTSVYVPYSTQFGSFYCGGNVGSIIKDGSISIDFNHEVIIYNKVVGGCNNAKVSDSDYNAAYEGGLIGAADGNGNKLELNLNGLKIQPKRWKDETNKALGLEWNTFIDDDENDAPATSVPFTATGDDMNRRFKGGNIYGGCYNSGIVNGNVVINIKKTIVDRIGEYGVFDIVETDEETGESLYGHDGYNITERRSGVILDEQGMDVLGSALNVFGGGKGAGTSIIGSTTINLESGYVFQVFGGSEEGVIGAKDNNGNYTYNANYSTHINLKGSVTGVARGVTGDSPNMAEAEFIYGGGFEGLVCGDTHINLGNGRIFNSFAGSCNADILGHTETYVGRNSDNDEDLGFPYIRDHIYGGNDLGGSILAGNSLDFKDRIRDEVKEMVAETHPVSSYMEYNQGRVRNILGGCFGDYDYTDDAYKNRVAHKPYLHNAFVNFRPNTNPNNAVEKIFGAGQGYSGDRDGDKLQDHSYVLIDIPDNVEKFANTEVFGAGAYNGLGMRYPAADTFVKGETPFDLNEASAIIDLMRGRIGAAYGGSYEEGVTRRTMVNVPVGSTIKIGSIFGGAYGSDAYKPCDVYEANVNYLTQNEDAYLISDPTGTNKLLKGAIFGGNNFARRTLYGKINISARVRQKHPTYGMTTATIYGAGCGALTWSEYTEVNLNNGANVWEVYGGGEAGSVMSAESVQKYISDYKPTIWPKAENTDPDVPFTVADWKAAWTLGSGYDAETLSTGYAANQYTNLKNPLVRAAEMDDRVLTDDQKASIGNKYNTNILIHEGAYVGNYAYGGGYGIENQAFVGSGDVYGTTYIALLGGTVGKDIYAAGTSGSVYNIFGAENYTASANAYIKGGTVRNVYGGGWRGSVGYHSGAIGNVAKNASDIDGEVHVVVGDLAGTTQTDGIPSITRNVYGGGEGGAIYGDAYVKMNKGYIGYRYNSTGDDDNQTEDFDERYVPELDDVVAGDNKLDQGGNIFGGGYVANSYVDRSHVTMMGGIVRGSLYGGGEIGPIGRGTVHADSIVKYQSLVMNGAAIYKGGETHVYLWDGHVMRDVFGGGRGYDNWGGEGYMTDTEKLTMDKSSKGYVFGSTDVHIYGGEVGTETNVLKGYGNVFGGGNEGFVYSATGTKCDDGYYHKNGNTSEGLSEDCKVTIEPKCKVNDADGVTIGDDTYAQGDYVELGVLNKLKSREHEEALAIWNKLDTRGIVVHNALFAGGNITEGSDKIFANTVTVFGNAAASLRDVYNFDLISLGTEEMGGLYGDGNLTLVDGFREIHIDNYGTDYYSLQETLQLSEYNALTPRQQAYYKLKYGAKSTHTYDYWESNMLHTDEATGISYRKGQKIPRPSQLYDDFTSKEKENWSQGSKSYKEDEQIEEGEYSLMDGVDSDKPEEKTGEKANWTLLGVTSIYAGRPMNTIQRADFCGVFGSRLVMKGAVDRAPQVNGGVDYNNYTINRVEEVSLNKRLSLAGDASTSEDYEHGNYFGIYNSVKFLGNLTSDVLFSDKRQTNTENTSIQADGITTYYDWKKDRPQNKYRNNGTSHNKVALASGVYLELKKEETESAGEDKWGYITGIIELDLINVMPGMGGGYVYAKNEHGKRNEVATVNKVSLINENTKARTYRQYDYDETTTTLEPIETSGNFVHNVKQIVDDCYPNGGIYNDNYAQSPAHYWFIRGSIYVYEQYISAFTGAANATAEKQEIPLTITAASNGRMTLRDVKPNYYAYYDKGGNKLGDLTVNADTVFVVNNVAYKLNQPISNWDYSLLSDGDKAKFVDQTYVVIADCKIETTEYKKGTVMLASEYNTLRGTTPPTVTYTEDGVVKTDLGFDYFFRSSNNLSHDTGYILTYDVNNPMVWNNYYTKTASPGQADALNTKQYVIDEKDKNGQPINKSDYTEGPTYTLTNGSASVYGQQDYNKGSILYGSVVNNYETNVKSHLASTEGQATVEQAYVLTTDYSLKNSSGEVVQELTAGTPVYKSKYYSEDSSKDLWTGKLATVTEKAKVCTSLLEFSTTDYVFAGQILTSADISELKTKVKEKNTGWSDEQAMSYLNSYLDDAYYCTSEGKYGGTYFQPGKAYRAIDTWCSMSADERANFTFNYDALDLLIDPNFSGAYGSKTQYDGNNPVKVYSSSQPIDYQAEFKGYVGDNSQPVTSIEYTPKSGTKVTINKSTSQSEWLSRDDYEAIPNEKRHYSPIIVTAPGKYYMVKTSFMNGEVPYTVGQQIEAETYDNLGTKKENIDVFDFTSAQTNTPTTVDDKQVYEPKTYYYCRNNYTIDEKGEGKAVTTEAVTKNNEDVSSTTFALNSSVPQGVVINETTYDGLCNFQKGFVIHGTSPTEVSTLYISNESDIHNLSTEKIITVVYLYEYDESDETGLNVTPVSERHILNIHITFKSGVPEIGEISKPDLVLPGTTLGMNIPSVTQGAFRVTESGWEIFTNDDDAATHYNGTPFFNNETPLYWYQDNYWIAYYAQTSLGRTYSNSVKLNVANYHDLKKVMDDKEHHYYIDHKDVERQPKIYINDYSGSGENGLDLFKDLIDLSYINKTYDSDGNPVPVSSGRLSGHVPLDLTHTSKPMRGGQYLDFFLHDNLSYTDTDAENDWTPIANGSGECFSGTLHGEGHTISGLDNSLFGHLCGDVYNLGVTGSFTGAGVADTGDGYVENCWVKTTTTTLPEGASKVNAVFGNPTDNTDYQLVNSYFWSGNAALYNTAKNETTGIITSGGDRGKARAMDERSFYNGELSFDLNGFYLYKRYCDNKPVAGGLTYPYYTVSTNNSKTLHINNDDIGHYGSNAELCSSGVNGGAYVEERYQDGDFRYADGSIPASDDIRQYTVKDDNNNDVIKFAPIWPDDYLFFGQSLTFDYNGAHQSNPTNISKSGGRLITGTNSNRVYRAPAYYGSKTMGVAHFNPVVNLAAYSKSTSDTSNDGKEAYPGMTAIDFAGHNDGDHMAGLSGNWFYTPLLDDDGIESFANHDETRNLLVYAPADPGENGTHTTYSVLNRDVKDLDFSAHTTENDPYNRVKVATTASSINGHLVLSDKTTNRDHLLVDKEDFNCPIAYTMGSGKRMWYQRKPDNYVTLVTESGVEKTKGWENISLPFSPALVTTQDKGEITHFFQGSNTGHEYWLRNYAGINTEASTSDELVAIFTSLSSAESGSKDNANTFLWDYYYSKSTQKDANSDEYKTYYNATRTYAKYPYQKADTPYLIGFPGVNYYEFDLSGNFVAQNTFAPIDRLGAQTITFVSDAGAPIVVSDDNRQKVTENGYTYVPNYMNKKLADDKEIFVLSAEGDCYVKTAGATISAFRPYIVVAGSEPQTRGTEPKENVERVVFEMDDSGNFFAHGDPKNNLNDGTMDIYAKRQKVIVESNLRYVTDVRIVNVAGMTLSSFSIEPGETIDTRVESAGVYIVYADNGKYVKKVIVK